jgi:hypothetical protein
VPLKKTNQALLAGGVLHLFRAGVFPPKGAPQWADVLPTPLAVGVEHRAGPWRLRLVAAEVRFGRIVALYDCSSTLYQIHGKIRYLFF